MAISPPAQSALLKSYNTMMNVGRVGCVVLTLVVGGMVFSKLAYAKEAVAKEGSTSARTQRKMGTLVLLGTVISGGFAGLLAYGAVTMALEPMKKKMLWSIYKVEGETRTLKVSGLTFDEVQTRVSQMENRELGAIFESVPE